MNKEKQKKLIQKAKRKAKKIQLLRKDPRYLKVMGKFKKEGWIDADVSTQFGKIFLEDALWVGEMIEPRVLELLPAVFIKRPGILLYLHLDEKLKIAAHQLSRGNLDGDFMGIPLTDCYQWIGKIGRIGKFPSIMKSHRFGFEEQMLLAKLTKFKKMSESQVIREAIKKLVAAL